MYDEFNFQPESFPSEVLMEQASGPWGELDESDELDELEEERGGRTAPRARTGFSARRRSPAGRVGGIRAKPPRPPRPQRPQRPPRPSRPRWPWPRGPLSIGYGVAGPERTQEGSEHVRWIQDCLNRAMSAQLPVDGVMTPAARSLVRSFQQQQGLTANGIVGPDTEEALKKACAGGAAPAPGDAAPPADGGNGDAGDAGEISFWETEAPAPIQGAVRALPSGAPRPKYEDKGRLADAINNVKGPGLYLITFTVNGKRRGYSGQSTDVRRRLMQHRLCAQMLGLPVDDHRVLVAPMAADLRSTEKAIHTTVKQTHPGYLTNQRRELEAMLLGEAWL
jgi:peptidoglycan hydrolase-like protein with peptidoglycan-binding domain